VGADTRRASRLALEKLQQLGSQAVVFRD
jgi:hypothetical protein